MSNIDVTEAFNVLYDAVHKPQQTNNDNSSTLEEKLDKLIDLQSKVASPDRLISIEEVSKLCGFERSKIYDLIKNNDLPAPIKFGRASRWKLSDIQSWIAKQ